MTRLALILLLLAAPAKAEPWTCTMTVRCDGTHCTAIDETYTIIAADHEGRLFLTTPAGDRPVTRLGPRATRPAIYESDGLPVPGEVLSIAADGLATHTAPPSGTPPRRHSTHGICEAL